MSRFADMPRHSHMPRLADLCDDYVSRFVYLPRYADVPGPLYMRRCGNLRQFTVVFAICNHVRCKLADVPWHNHLLGYQYLSRDANV